MTKTTTGLHTVPLASVLAWPNLNPRITFDQARLDELAASIKDDGLLQPVSVAPAGLKKGAVRFWLFAGERRLRAVKIAGLKTIDIIVKDIDEATAHRLAGIENIERNDLTAIEEAIWLARELELTGKSQKELGEDLGRSQAWIANRIRLLTLPKPIQTMIHKGTIAPAMARDTLLRFLKLDKAVQPKLWKAITAEIKRAAKNESPVLLNALEGAVEDAIRESGAAWVRGGYQYRDGDYMNSFTVSEADLKGFKEAHAGQCVQVPGRHHESLYTFAADEWDAVLIAKQKTAKSSRPTGGVSKKKLENPKLGPTKAPVDRYKLQQEYGHDNVIAFSEIVDVSKIKPTSVVHVKTHRAGGEGVELMYVGPNVRALKGARTRRATPIRAEEAAKVQSSRMDKGADLKTAQLFVGLLGLIIDTNYSDTLHAMIETELGRAVEWSRYEFNTKKLQELKVPATSVRRIAAGLARIALRDDRRSWYDLNGDIEKAVEKRVTKDSAKARKEWLAEHAPEVSK